MIINSVVDCGLIPNVENAFVAGSLPAGSTYYDTLVTYSCKPLFWFSRDVFNKSIKCQATGNWTVLNAFCQRKKQSKQNFIKKLTIV